MQKLCCYDTEFLERGSSFPIIFISIGIVDEDGKEFYAVDERFDAFIGQKDLFQHTFKLGSDTWVYDNVISKLGKDKSAFMSLDQVKEGILKFVGDAIPMWTAYYCSYDHVVLSQLFGRMVDLPEKWPKYTIDLKQLAMMTGFELPEDDPNTEHNALGDARWVMSSFQLLQKIEGLKNVLPRG